MFTCSIFNSKNEINLYKEVNVFFNEFLWLKITYKYSLRTIQSGAFRSIRQTKTLEQDSLCLHILANENGTSNSSVAHYKNNIRCRIVAEALVGKYASGVDRKVICVNVDL